MGLKDDDGKIGADRYNHQRQEQVVAARQLGNEEHTCQRGMHYAAHYACHPHQGKVLFRQVGRHIEFVAEVREYEAGNTTQVKRGGKDTAATTSSVSGARSEYLEEDDEHQVDE